MKTKLAIIIPSLNGGGAERVVVNIVKNIDRSKFNVRFILIKKEGPYLNLIPNDIVVVDINSNRVRHSLIKLIKELNQFKPDVIFSTLGHLNLALLSVHLFLKGNPKIIVREANTPSQILGSLSFPKRIFFKYLYKHLYPRAHLIIAQCAEMKRDIIDYLKIDESKIKYIYNPLDVETIKNSVEQKNPYDNSEINFLAVGRLSYQKGFDILIDAFKIVLDKHPDAHLTILGDGVLKNDLIIQAQKLGILSKITFSGFKVNPYAHYYYVDAYVLSSRWEGFPNTLLEAMACGCKVVAFDCKSGPSEIIGDNVFGILVKKIDCENLADGMIRAICEENKVKNRAYDFNISTIIRQYEEVLNVK